MNNVHFFRLFLGEPMLDYSVRVSHLNRSEIMEELGLANQGVNTEKHRKTLAKRLKDKHPIHQKVKKFSNHELNSLLSNLSLPIPSHRPRKMKAILDYFFREFPDAPLTNLIRILEEDSYFGQLTSGKIFI